MRILFFIISAISIFSSFDSTKTVIENILMVDRFFLNDNLRLKLCILEPEEEELKVKIKEPKSFIVYTNNN